MLMLGDRLQSAAVARGLKLQLFTADFTGHPDASGRSALLKRSGQSKRSSILRTRPFKPTVEATRVGSRYLGCYLWTGQT